MAARKSGKGLVVMEHIAQRILLVRGHKVMLDADLAALYGVPAGRLNEQVKRNMALLNFEWVNAPHAG